MPENQNDEETIFLSFLARAKDGEFAPIETSSLEYLRVHEQTEIIEKFEEDYIYCTTG